MEVERGREAPPENVEGQRGEKKRENDIQTFRTYGI